MNYVYNCKKCGFNFMSNDKQEVKQAKEDHKQLFEIKEIGYKSKRCKDMVVCEDKIIRRKQLADKLGLVYTAK